jgi:hypothetical protein
VSDLQVGVRCRRRRWFTGGILTYAVADLMAEVAYLAQVFHWPLSSLLDLEHPDRHRFIELAQGTDGQSDQPAAAYEH